MLPCDAPQALLDMGIDSRIADEDGLTALDVCKLGAKHVREAVAEKHCQASPTTQDKLRRRKKTGYSEVIGLLARRSPAPLFFSCRRSPLPPPLLVRPPNRCTQPLAPKRTAPSLVAAREPRSLVRKHSWRPWL